MISTEAPERIWLQRGQATDPAECTLSHVSTDGTGDVEYVRADLAFDIEVANTTGQSIRLVLTQKPKPDKQ